jgi:hypothetical protein
MLCLRLDRFADRLDSASIGRDFRGRGARPKLEPR